jgi:hypothetical protein
MALGRLGLLVAKEMQKAGQLAGLLLALRAA